MRIEALVALALCACPLAADMPVDPCQTVAECIHRVHDVAKPPETPYSYISDSERALIDRFLQIGEEAVPSLVGLLDDPNEDVAQVAAAALRDIESIDETHFQKIVEGLDRGLPWLPPALGRIDSPRAAEEAVKRLLVSESAPHNQEAYAVKLSGSRAVPFIVDAVRCEQGCTDHEIYVLGEVLSEMEGVRGEAAPGLLSIALDKEARLDQAVDALYVIGRLGEDGLAVEPDLLEMRESNPELMPWIDQALIGIRSSASGEAYARILRSEIDSLIFQDISETGPAAHDAGPTVMSFLSNLDWGIRLGAARALGYIQYKPAAESLAEMLFEPEDVRLNFVAAESLGRMRATSAIAALSKAAESHWYPPVRDAANRAIENIENGTENPVPVEWFGFAHEYYSYQRMGRDLPQCEEVLLQPSPEPDDVKLYRSDAEEQLDNLAYDAVIVGFGPSEESLDEQIREGRRVIEVNQGNITEYRETIRQVPDLALRAEDGWLAGSTRGEWGGELVFINNEGASKVLIEANVEDVYQFDQRFIAVTGLAHLFMNGGMLYEVTRKAGNSWSVKPWRALPGAPISSWPVESGEILINTVSGGSILVDASGYMRMAPCSQ